MSSPDSTSNPHSNTPDQSSGHGHGHTAAAPSPFHQPKAVWAVAFACVVSFMGIGLVEAKP
jgi:hypothetical protein